MFGKKSKKAEGSKVFNVDITGTMSRLKEIPTITSLLNRKSLKKKVPTPPPFNENDQKRSPPEPPRLSQNSGLIQPPAPGTRSILIPPEFRKQKEHRPEVAMPSLAKRSSAPVAPTPPTPPVDLPQASGKLMAKVIKIPQRSTTARITPTDSSAPRSAPVSPLKEWTQQEIDSRGTPLHHAVSVIFHKDPKAQILYLAPPRPLEGDEEELDPASVLEAKSCFLPGKKKSLWQGLRWKPNQTPKQWAELQKTTFLEFTAPEKLKAVDSAHIIWSALGAKGKEKLTLIRLGLPRKLAGVLCVISQNGLIDLLGDSIAVFKKVPPRETDREPTQTGAKDAA